MPAHPPCIIGTLLGMSLRLPAYLGHHMRDSKELVIPCIFPQGERVESEFFVVSNTVTCQYK